VEAHDPNYEMFGFPRLGALIAEHDEERSLVDSLLEELYSFTGEGWEQEDDITLLTLRSSATLFMPASEKAEARQERVLGAMCYLLQRFVMATSSSWSFMVAITSPSSSLRKTFAPTLWSLSRVSGVGCP
jgi:Stage II sporulation protein E (SpoIIE)